MKTIGAKELRLNLEKVLDRVIAGEEIIVKHRFKEPVRLIPQNKKIHRNNGADIAQRLQTLAPELKLHQSMLDPAKTYKELYDELLQSDPKYSKYFK